MVRDPPGASNHLSGPPEQLPSSEVVLKPFQCDGIGWIVAHLKSTTTTTTTHGGVILADEMGLGKTIQSIGAAFSPELLHPVTDAGRALLIVAPLSVLSSWKREIERVMTRTEVGGGGPTRRCPLRIAVYSGSVEDRDEIIARVEASVSVGPTHRPSSHGSTPLLQTAYDVFITTPDYLLRDAFFLSRLAYRMLVFDEAHRLKNFHTKLFRLLIREYVPRIPKRLLLTGTPLSNTPVELWSLILLCNFETLGMFHESFSTQLMEEMEAKKRSGGAAKAETTAAFDVLLKLRSRFVLRRLKEDVLVLPPLREVVLASPLSPLQRKLYGAILVKDMTMVLGNHATQKGKNAAPPTALLNVVMQLRKCCNHPYMFPGVEKEPFVIGEHIVNHSGKMVILDRLLHQELLPHGHRVLLFSQFSYMLDILQDYCTFRKISHVRLDGSVRGEDRNEAVDTFQSSSHCNVFLLSTRAGGVGLTLTAADTVIFYDSDWNPQMDLQAQQRAHRIGQTKPVTVYRLSVSGTVESLMLNAAARKRTMASSFLRNAGGPEMSHGTAEDEPTDDDGTSRVDWKAALLWTAAAFPEIGSGHEGGGGGLTMSKDSALTRDELTPLRPSSSEVEPSADSDNAWESFLRSLDLLAMLRADDGISTTTTTAELNVGSVFVTESAASQRAAFELTLKRGAEVLKDLASKQAFEARKAREQAAALEDAGGRKRRTNWEDIDDEDALRRSATTLTTRKKTTELERWRRLEKLWKKASYHSGALPLGLELFTASPPSVTASIDAPLLETPSLTTTTDIVRSLDDDPTAPPSPTMASHSVFGLSLLRAAEAELTKEQGTSTSIREESLRFCTVMASPPPPPSPPPPSSPDPKGEDAAAAKRDGEEEEMEEEDDERAADFNGEALEHVRGNVFAPQALPLTSSRNHKRNNKDLPPTSTTTSAAAKGGGELQLIVIPVNNSGTWSSGGLFGAMAAFAPSVAHRYYHAQDLRLGDAHVFFSPSVSAWSRQMVLIVVQRASTMTGDSGGGLDPKSLTLAFRRIARYSSVVQQRTGLNVTVHFPHVPTLTTGAAYALDKIVAAHLLVPPPSEEEEEQLPAVAESELGTSWATPHQASRTAPVVQRCCIYHYSRRGGGGMDRGRRPPTTKRGREDSSPSSLPRPSPPLVARTTPAVYASSTPVAISSHSFCFLPPFGPSSAALQRSITLQGGVLCSVDDAVFALMVEKKNSWNGGPLIIVGQSEEGLAKWRPHGATVMTEGELAKIL